jgi:hypothetical protein
MTTKKKDEERDVVICPKCKIEMFAIEQKQRDGVVKEIGIIKCFRCTFAISSDHWMLSLMTIKAKDYLNVLFQPKGIFH